MYAWLETHPIAYSDSDILSLSWKGSVPLSEKEKQYIRKRSCVTGWVAVGTRKCVVGVTFSSIHTLKEYNYPLRTNFNLRGHNAEVVLVRWNEPFQKMATCDANGVIFVWIRFESRWSIELVNDRQHQVTDFAWSHDGRMALIAYKDGFVLVGSVQGQRYWSSQLNLQPHGSTITCGAWTPDDKTVLFGTNSGQVVAMDIHGAVLSQVGLSDRTKPIQYMCYNCEKFRMSYVTESIDGENRITSGGSSGNSASIGSGSSGRSGVGSSDCSRRNRGRNKNVMIAVQMGSREINFMRSYDDVVGSNVTDTHMTDLRMEWSSCGSLLAVAGWCCDDKSPKLKFYSLNGIVRFTLNIPSKRSISALTWAHNDKRMFVASGAGVFVVFVEKHLSSLQQLARNSIVECLSHHEDSSLEDLHLPPHLKKFVACALQPTITPCFPKGMDLMKFVSTPPPVQKDPQTGEEKTTRYFCTMIVYEDERGPRSVSDKYGGPFVLYREYMGGLVPLLRGDKISKVRPEFVVYNPQDDNFFAEISANAAATTPTFDPNIYPSGGNFSRQKSGQSLPSSPDPKKSLNELAGDDDNESGGAGCDKEYVSPLSGTEADRDESGSSYSRRKKKKKRKGQFRTPVEKVSLRPADLPFPDKLPEKDPLIEVLANLWGTKFRLHGIHPNLPTDVGYVCYKTSVLHLQPRQMTIAIPLLDGSTRNVKSTSIGTVVFPGSGNALAGNNFPASCAPNFRPASKDANCARGNSASATCKEAPLEYAATGRGGITAGGGCGEQAATSSNSSDVSMVPAAFFSCPSASNIGVQSAGSSTHKAVFGSELCRFEQMHALRCRFLQQAQHSLSCDVKNTPTDFASDEEMEQRVIKAAKSVKSGQPLEVAAAVASVLTNRSDDPVVSPVQRCPKHPPITALVAGPGGNSTNSVPLATSADLQLFAFPRFSAASPQLGAHSAAAFPCRNYHHHLHQRMLHHRANIGNFGGSNGHVNNVSFLQRKVTCKPRPSLAVRPKSCFPGATAAHGRSPAVTSNMFLSLPPVPPPPLAPKPGVTPSSRPSAILSDDESAESGNENEKNIAHVASGSKATEGASSIKSNSKNCANVGPCKSSISNSLSPGVACSGDLLYSVTLSAVANQSNLCSTISHAHSKSLINNCSFQSCNFPLAAHYTNCEPCTPPQCKLFPYYRTRSCPPSQESLTLEKLSAQFTPCSAGGGAAATTSSNATTPNNPQLSCRGEAAVRSKLGLMSLAPPSTAFGASNSSDKRHTREASWSIITANSNRKSSPIGGNRHSSGGVGQYNLCNNKAAGGDTSDSEAYLSGDEAAAAAITNPELRRRQMRKFRKLPRKPENLPKSSEKEEFVMLNKSPIWNESTQVYQLDFGGRVTQESAKNFQIEHNKEQVLQFGRIDENAYTLDFQTPFSALQAFGIALANVTQRLK